MGLVRPGTSLSPQLTTRMGLGVASHSWMLTPNFIFVICSFSIRVKETDIPSSSAAPVTTDIQEKSNENVTSPEQVNLVWSKSRTLNRNTVYETSVWFICLVVIGVLCHII